MGVVLVMEVLTTAQLKNIPPPEWLIEDFVAEKNTTVIYGMWGTGKSFVVLDMALTASVGGEWLGGRKISRPLRTLFVVAEGASWWGARIEAYERYKGPVNEDNLLWIPEPVALFDPSGRGSTPDGVVELEEIIADFNPDILVFDTWVRCTGAFGMDENSAGDTARVMRELDRMREQYGLSVVIVHHPKKDGGARGSGNLLASVERVIKVDAAESAARYKIKIEDEKGNHTTPFEEFYLKFESVAIDVDHEGEAITSAVVVPTTHESITERPTGGPTNAGKVLGWLELNPGEYTQKELADYAGVKSGSIRAALVSLESGGHIKQTDDKKWRLA